MHGMVPFGAFLDNPWRCGEMLPTISMTGIVASGGKSAKGHGINQQKALSW